MSTGDELRMQALNAVARLEQAAATLQQTVNLVNEAVGEILAINLGGGSNSHHVRSAGRIAPVVMDDLEGAQEKLMHVQSEMANYYRSIGGFW